MHRLAEHIYAFFTGRQHAADTPYRHKLVFALVFLAFSLWAMVDILRFWLGNLK